MTSLAIERRRPLHAKVGILSIGHHVYWQQFEGLLDEMHRKVAHLRNRVEANGVEVAEFGMLDNAASA